MSRVDVSCRVTSLVTSPSRAATSKAAAGVVVAGRGTSSAATGSIVEHSVGGSGRNGGEGITTLERGAQGSSCGVGLREI